MPSASELLALRAISPLDGRYSSKLPASLELFSEFSLIKRRVQVEVAYLLFLAKQSLIPQYTRKQLKALKKIVSEFDETQAMLVKELERKTRHDVKAIEYYLQEKLRALHIQGEEYLHLALTSEDINSVANSLLLQAAKNQVLVPKLQEVLAQLTKIAEKYAELPMLARTHGQPALPTTVGKELIVFAVRLLTELQILEKLPVEAKLNGAVGNFNAHTLAFPQVNWQKLSFAFITKLDLKPQTFTTQILPTESYSRIFSSLIIINNILLDLSQDMWRYISDNYFTQKLETGQIGSSTMPQKINPIEFENSEGNLGLANSLFNFFITKLPISRLQRDLSDSTVKRNFGVACGYSLLAYDSLLKGLKKVSANTQTIASDLDQHLETLAEAFQVVLRVNGDTQGYEKLRHLTQGKKVTAQTLTKLANDSLLPQKTKLQLKKLTPKNYLGLAPQLTQQGIQIINTYLKGKL